MENVVVAGVDLAFNPCDPKSTLVKAMVALVGCAGGAGEEDKGIGRLKARGSWVEADPLSELLEVSMGEVRGLLIELACART